MVVKVKGAGSYGCGCFGEEGKGWSLEMLVVEMVKEGYHAHKKIHQKRSLNKVSTKQ